MSDDLEERLRSHARSFDGLLSLIPAKLYYGEDVSDQWQRKKQTPEQKRAAKMAKLNPANWKSAKDVMDEREANAKRKRDDERALDTEDAVLAINGESSNPAADEETVKTKRRKVDDSPAHNPASAPLSVEEKRAKKMEKKAAKKEKLQKAQEKRDRQKLRREAEKLQNGQGKDVEMSGSGLVEDSLQDTPLARDEEGSDQESTASSENEIPDVFSPPAESGTSSISSLPLSITEHQSKPKSSKQTKTPQPKPQTSSQQPQQNPVERDAARERLANAISTFRTARKADAPNTVKPRNRAELLEQRRQKEEARRAAKKEQRRKEREEAARQEDEEIARRFSPGGSGSLLASPRSPPTKDSSSSSNNFSYGRIEFGDGSKIDSTNLANGLLNDHKRKGHQDAQTALKAAQNKASRLAGLDEQKRKEIEEKDMWLNAKKRAHGERVKDDTSLLKKALKRQEGQKKKSEKEWTERKEGITKAQESKQKRRNDNLAKRKDEKFAHKVGKKGKKVKKRPGFEGSFRGRTGGKSK